METLNGRYEEFDHTADLGLALEAPSLEDLYGLAVKATCSLMGELRAPGTHHQGEVMADGVDHEDLLVCLLSEVLARFELDAAYVTHAGPATLSQANGLVHAKVPIEWVEIDHDLEGGLAELKAVTYHGISVKEADSGWKARVIFDL